MSDLDDKIGTLRTELTAAIAGADDADAVEAIRVFSLGKKGSISALLSTLGSMDPEQRKTAGAAINGLKSEITGLIEAKAALAYLSDVDSVTHARVTA